MAERDAKLVRFDEQTRKRFEAMQDDRGIDTDQRALEQLVRSGLTQWEAHERPLDDWLFYVATAATLVALALISVVLVLRIPAYHLALFASVFAMILMCGWVVRMKTIASLLTGGV